jgi:hypothetical protein
MTRLLTHKQAVFDHLVGRWHDLFNISYDVLLDDLTSTYFEADPPFRKATSAASGTRAITGRIVCRSSLPPASARAGSGSDARGSAVGL